MCVCVYVCMCACARASKLNQQICILPAPGRSSKFTHACVEIDTCAFQTGCQLPRAASGMSLGLCFLTQFQWHEAIVLDKWQLAELPQSGGREFDPRRVHDNLSVPLWVCMRFPVPEHQNYTKNIYACLHVLTPIRCVSVLPRFEVALETPRYIEHNAPSFQARFCAR